MLTLMCRLLAQARQTHAIRCAALQAGRLMASSHFSSRPERPLGIRILRRLVRTVVSLLDILRGVASR
jgi:hypothetical protein